MKKILLFTFLFLLSLSCSKDDKILNLPDSGAEIEFSGKGGEITYSFWAESNWEIYFNEINYWCEVSPLSGNARESTITITVPGNSYSREISFSLLFEEQQQDFVVCQSAENQNTIDGGKIANYYAALNYPQDLKIEKAGIVGFKENGVEIEAVSGMISDYAWFGIFEEIKGKGKYKTPIQWKDEKPTDPYYTDDRGYGDVRELSFRELYLDGIVMTDDENFCVVFSKRYSENPPHFVDNANLVFRANGVYNNIEIEKCMLGGLKSWYGKSFMIRKGINEGNYAGVVLYSETGQEIYQSTGYHGYASYDNYLPVNYEEGIGISASSVGHVYVGRFNFKTDSEIWSTHYTFDLSEKAEFKNAIKTGEDGNNWYYSIEFILFSGKKEIRNIVVDIETGTIIEE